MRDRRVRKSARTPSYRGGANDLYDPETIPQYFQISVNVLEARKLNWASPQSACSYVVVVLGRKKHRTTVRKNQEEPTYREEVCIGVALHGLIPLPRSISGTPDVDWDSNLTWLTFHLFARSDLLPHLACELLRSGTDIFPENCNLGVFKARVDKSIYLYLVFEMYMSIREIQRSSLWLAVMEPKCYAPPRMLGEATIDLGAVWSQPNHQVYHKWVQLSLPRDSPTSGPVGFLKVDVSIIFRGEIQVMPAIISDEKVEDQLLLPMGSEQQRAKYLLTVHAAFNLPSSVQSHSDRRLGKPPTTYIRITFCGLVGKTAVQQRANDPIYSEQISIVEMFPNMNQIIRFEVCSAETCFNRVMASAELTLGEISHDGDNGFVPTFGPSLLHMYGASSGVSSGTSIEDGPFHKGSILASLRTVVPYYQQATRTVTVEPVAPIRPEDIWVQEEFCIYCPIFEISMLDCRIVKRFTGVAITIAEIPSTRKMDEEFNAMMTECKSRKLHYTGALEIIKTKPNYGAIEFRQEFPVLQLATRLPDFRFRMYRNNIVQGIINDLEHSISEVEKHLYHFDYSAPNELIDDLNKAVDDAAGHILKFLDIVNYSSNSSSSEDSLQQYSTELDQRQLALQKEELERIYNQITRKTKLESVFNILQVPNKCVTKESLVGTRKGVKLLLAETKTLAESLRNTIHKTVDGWPDLIVWLVSDGSRVAYTKIKVADIVYSVIPEQCGRQCGRIQTIYMKPFKCSKHVNAARTNCLCLAGKVELVLWMGLFRQRHAFRNCMPAGYFLKISEYDMHIKSTTMVLECRAFIYRAKLKNEGNDTPNNSFNAFVRLYALCNVKDTQVKLRTTLPVWNQVLKVQKLTLGSPERLNHNPPYCLVEVYDDDLTGKTELIGRFQIQPVIEDRPGYAPRLQWYDIFKGSQNTGQILMSVQMLQIPEQVMKSTIYSEESLYVCNVKESLTDTEAIEQLPSSLIPQSMSYKTDIYWWGLRDVNITRKPLVVLEIDDLAIKSEIIMDRKSNSNFPNGRMSQIFESPFNEEYSPSLCIRLYDSSTFGRTLFLGTNVIKNPSKYIIDWLPKNEREASLKTISIVSSDFCEVGGQMVYVKKSKVSIENEETLSNYSHKNTDVCHAKTKNHTWKRLFNKKEPTEEEITLLPIYTKENDQIKVVKRMQAAPECGDWWMRFFQSEKIKNIYEDGRSSGEFITIYDYELECQPEFYKFKDWCSTLKLYNGKKTGIPEKDEQLQCGLLKAGIAIYKWPPPENVIAVALNGVELQKGFFGDHPSNDRTKYIVRVYVVKCKNLPTDTSRKSDPYLIMNCGKRLMGDRKNHVTNTTEPIFGSMYEFSCNIPEDYMLTISLYDYDVMPPDELIGRTSIDLEDRIYSKHRARVGLAPEYTLSGPSKWRDSIKPSVILEELCAKNHIPPPIFPDTYSVLVNGVEYRDNSAGRVPETSYPTAAERKENICLSILHKWQTLPICGYQLVPEHVETRSLFHPDKPGIERGKILMWVDIFPLDASSLIPPPRDITPRKIEEYELRVIVWDVQCLAIDQDQQSWKTTNIYVKIWIGPETSAQQTDIHYNSLSGEGNFNWRMVFSFLYHHAERKMVNKQKGPFTEYEEFLQPILEVHVLENSEDEFLGLLSLNLNSMYKGAKLAQRCTLDAMESGKNVNLFTLKSIRAWWPLKNLSLATGEEVHAGVVDLEMTLLPREKAVLMPVGVGRDPPSPLPDPNRPQESTIKEKRSYCEAVTEFFSNRGKEIIIYFVILSVVWFLAYLLYLAIPASDNSFISRMTNRPGRHRTAEGILRTLYSLHV